MKRRMDNPALGEQGAIAVLFAILLPVVLALAALVIDLGRGWENRRLLQNCVDGAALAGAYEVTGLASAVPAIETAVNDYLSTHDNGFCLSDTYVEAAGLPVPEPAADAYSVDVYDGDGDGSLNQVRVTMARGVPTLIARAAGVLMGSSAPEFMPVMTSAVAAKGDVLELKGAMPFALLACDGEPPPLGAAGPWDCPWNDIVYDPTTGACDVDLNRVWLKSWDPVADTYQMVHLKSLLDLDDAGYPTKVTIKVNPGGQFEAGNFQALELGGEPQTFRRNVQWGFDGWLGDCDAVFTQPGNRAGQVTQGLYTDDDTPLQYWPDGKLKISRVNRDAPPYYPTVPAGGHPDSALLLHDVYERVVKDSPSNDDHVNDEPWECPRLLYIPIVGNAIDKGSGKFEVRVLTWAVMFLDNPAPAPPGQAKSFVDAYFVDPQKRAMPPKDWSEVGGLDPTSWLPTGIRLIG